MNTKKQMHTKAWSCYIRSIDLLLFVLGRRLESHLGPANTPVRAHSHLAAHSLEEANESLWPSSDSKAQMCSCIIHEIWWLFFGEGKSFKRTLYYITLLFFKIVTTKVEEILVGWCCD